MTMSEEDEVCVGGFAEKRRTVGETIDLLSGSSPERTRFSTHEERAELFRGSGQVDKILRV